MPHAPRGLAAVLAALAAIGPFSIDTYLPAFPDMARSLGATSIQIQQTLTAYMATFAVMALWHGALSDCFGRRRVILVSMGLFSLASLLCAFAPAVEWLWAGRALQGMSAGAGMVVGRAVIRDLFDGPDAQRLMSRVMLIFGIAPAIAPLVGGVLLALAGWRSIFVFLALFSALLAYLTWRHLIETLPPAQRQPLALGGLARGYGAVLGSLAFLLLAGAVGLNFNGFFIYVLSAPVFLMEHLGLGATEFSWLFVPSVAGLMIGSVWSGKVAGRWSARRTIAVGFVVMLAAALINVAYSGLARPGVPWSVLPVSLYTVGMALAMPSLTLLALDLFPERRGMAASCQSFLQVGTNAICAGSVAPILWHTPLTLALGMGAFAMMGLLCWDLARRRGQG